MTERKRLKKELAWLVQVRTQLPMLIDCSEIYGDRFYQQSDIDAIDVKIALIKSEIANLIN